MSQIERAAKAIVSEFVSANIREAKVVQTGTPPKSAKRFEYGGCWVCYYDPEENTIYVKSAPNDL